MNAYLTFSVIMLLLAVLPRLSLAACEDYVPEDYGPNNEPLNFIYGISSLEVAPNSDIDYSYIIAINCSVKPLNSTHYIVAEINTNGNITNWPSIHQYKSIVNSADKNRPFTTNSLNIMQHVSQTSSPNQSNDYYNIRQDVPLNSSRRNSNRHTYNVRQEILRNSTPNPTTSSHIENTEENKPFNSRDCFLPEQPEGGRFDLDDCDKPCNKHFNNIVPEFSILTYTCKDNHILIGNTISICTNRKWTAPPSCLKICEPLRSTSVDISCSYQGEMVSCTKNVLPGTRAMLACKPSYSLPVTYDAAYREITCLNDGLWDNHVFHCLPVAACKDYVPEDYGPNSKPLNFINGISSLEIAPNPDIDYSYIIDINCSVKPLNSTHYIVRAEINTNGNITNWSSIHQYKSIVNSADKNRPFITNSSNIIQHVPQTSSPNQSNDYYNIRQDVPLNSSRRNSNRPTYNIRQEILQNSTPNPTTSSHIENTEENRPFNSRDCFLPEQPEGGHFELSNCAKACSKHSNDLVPQISILTYTCKDNYILTGNTISICIDGKWTTPPSCLKICEPLRSTSVDISCSYQSEMVSCTKYVLPGTRAMLACKPSYTLPLTYDPAYREIICRNDGLWDNLIFRCLPECGTSIANGNTLIVNGLDAKIGVFPWHVGIYFQMNMNEYEQICGGTLISSNLVISAAHCFYDEVFNKVNNVSNYAVGAGKYYRDWDAKEDYAQKSSVESIRIGNRYLGFRNNFADDIALLKLDKSFQLTTLVRPICIDWSNQYQREQLQQGQVGKVVGWGKNINDESSEILQEINMPYIPYHQCLSEVPVSFQGFITHDKFCAGYLNGSSVCDGDSGGGICFEKNGIWYLRGIVSVSPNKRGACDYNTYVGFTSVRNSLEWIRHAYVNA